MVACNQSMSWLKLLRLGAIAAAVLVLGIWLLRQWMRVDDGDVRGRDHDRKRIADGCRGRGLDARGSSVTVNSSALTVAADAVLLNRLDLPKPAAVAIVRKTAEVLGMDEREVCGKLDRRSNRVVIAHDVDTVLYQRLTNEIARLDFGVDEESLTRKQRATLARARRYAVFAPDSEDFRRVYPTGHLALPFVGYVDSEQKGAHDIEREFDSFLRSYRTGSVTQMMSK